MSSNYRAIALGSIFGKVFDRVLLNTSMDVFNVSCMQFGFKSKHSTSQCTFVMDEVINYYNTKGSNVYTTLLDASQAFDRVQYVKLFRLLLSKNICPLICRFLICMYTKQVFKVCWSGSVSRIYRISNGVKQGGILSPILFIVYIDVLLCRLSISGYGCYIGNMFYGAMGYADDIVILSPTVMGMDKSLEICSEFALEYNVLFNASKSKVICYKYHVSHIQNVSFSLMGNTIENSSVEKHLGHVVGNNSNNSVMDNARVGACYYL